MPPTSVHFNGSVNLPDAETVMREIASRIPRGLRRMTEGGLSYFFSARGQRLTESKPSWSAGSGGCGEDVEQDVGEFLGLQRR